MSGLPNGINWKQENFSSESTGMSQSSSNGWKTYQLFPQDGGASPHPIQHDSGNEESDATSNPANKNDHTFPSHRMFPEADDFSYFSYSIHNLATSRATTPPSQGSTCMPQSSSNRRLSSLLPQDGGEHVLQEDIPKNLDPSAAQFHPENSSPMSGYLIRTNRNQANFSGGSTVTPKALLNGRPHGQRDVGLAEDDFKYVVDSGNEKSDANPNPANQIYLTFTNSKKFTKEDVHLYFSKYGPVRNVRLHPTFGFVSFQNAETVKLILKERQCHGHSICGSHVRIKPYREKASKKHNPATSSANAPPSQATISPSVLQESEHLYHLGLHDDSSVASPAPVQPDTRGLNHTVSARGYFEEPRLARVPMDILHRDDEPLIEEARPFDLVSSHTASQPIVQPSVPQDDGSAASPAPVQPDTCGLKYKNYVRLYEEHHLGPFGYTEQDFENDKEIMRCRRDQ